MKCPSLSELPAPPGGKSGWPWTLGVSGLANIPDNGTAKPRVSVVTPSYNQCEFLEETIRSVLLQGYPDLEYIIMDGGSTDGSVGIIRKYEPWLSYWVSQTDEGQTQAINRGWGHATGDILAYLNADDSYAEGAVAAASRAFHANPKAGMVYGSALVIDQNGQSLRIWNAQPFDLRVMLTIGSIVPQPACFYAKNALKNVGWLDERWDQIMDYELSIRMGLRYPSVCLTDSLARFRDHQGSKTHRHFTTLHDELIRFVEGLSLTGYSPHDWDRIKHTALARIHYETALNFIAQGRDAGSSARKELLKSISQWPFFTLRRPLATAYMLKELLWGYVARLHFLFRDFATHR